jgi:hypothetical protein
MLRWQPITVDLATALAEHADGRGGVLPGDALLRYRHGAALSSRRYDHLWYRIGQHLPWVATDLSGNCLGNLAQLPSTT